MIDKKSKIYQLIDSPCPFDSRIEKIEGKSAQIIATRRLKSNRFERWER